MLGRGTAVCVCQALSVLSTIAIRQRPRRRTGAPVSARAAVLGVLLLAVVVLLAACGGSDAPPVAKLSAAEVQAKLAEPAPGATAAQRQIEDEAGQALSGGDDPAATLDARLKELRGTPVVVNIWGDWCVPCKEEMPIFQRVALAQRGQVAFLGVATTSSREKTEAYLRDQIAMPYPSILDDGGAVNLGTGVDSVPKTLFYDRAGKRTIHVGPYDSEAALLKDIERYAS